MSTTTGLEDALVIKEYADRKHLRSSLLAGMMYGGYAEGVTRLASRGDFSVPTHDLPFYITNRSTNQPELRMGVENLGKIGFVAAYAHFNRFAFQARDTQLGLDRFLGQLPEEIGSAISQELDNCRNTVNYVRSLNPERTMRKYVNWMFRHFHGGLTLIGRISGEKLDEVGVFPRVPHYQHTDKRGFARLVEVEEGIRHPELAYKK